MKIGKMMSLAPDTDTRLMDYRIAEFLFGWKWMAWTGIPTHSHPEYPTKCRVKQFMSPEQLANERWQEFFQHKSAEPAVGGEWLSYTHCSSGCSAACVPEYTGDDDAAVLKFVRKNWKNDNPELWAKFESNLPSAGDYTPGCYSFAALLALGLIERKDSHQ